MAEFFERLKLRVTWSCAGLRDTWLSEYSFRSWVWANVVSGGLAIWLLTGAELALILACFMLQRDFNQCWGNINYAGFALHMNLATCVFCNLD